MVIFSFAASSSARAGPSVTGFAGAVAEAVALDSQRTSLTAVEFGSTIVAGGGAICGGGATGMWEESEAIGDMSSMSIDNSAIAKGGDFYIKKATRVLALDSGFRLPSPSSQPGPIDTEVDISREPSSRLPLHAQFSPEVW